MVNIKKVSFLASLFVLLPLFFTSIYGLSSVSKNGDLFSSMKVANVDHPLFGFFDEVQFVASSEYQIRSGSILFKYRDTGNVYTYFDNVLDNDWVTCVPLLHYSDSSGWENYEINLTDVKCSRIKDLGRRYNNDDKKYTISDIELSSLYSKDFNYSGEIHDVVTFRADNNSIMISGVYRVLWSFKLSNSILTDMIPFYIAVSSLKYEIDKKSNILNDSSDSINSKYTIHKDNNEDFHVVKKAPEINNIQVLTSSDDSRPLDSIDVPFFEDNYSVIKIADFDSDDNKWIPNLPDSSWNDNLEEKIWDTGRFYVSVEYDNLLTYYDLKWLKNGQGSYIYDIVHLTSDNKCDFARRVALVGNNTKAMNAIKDIPSFGDESDLKLRYSNIAKKYNNEHPKIKEIGKETEEKIEEKIEELKDQNQEQDENQTNKKDQIIEKTVNNIKDNLQSLIKNTGDDTKYRLILLSLMLTCHTTLIFTSRKNEDL